MAEPDLIPASGDFLHIWGSCVKFFNILAPEKMKRNCIVWPFLSFEGLEVTLFVHASFSFRFLDMLRFCVLSLLFSHQTIIGKSSAHVSSWSVPSNFFWPQPQCHWNLFLSDTSYRLGLLGPVSDLSPEPSFPLSYAAPQSHGKTLGRKSETRAQEQAGSECHSSLPCCLLLSLPHIT